MEPMSRRDERADEEVGDLVIQYRLDAYNWAKGAAFAGHCMSRWRNRTRFGMVAMLGYYIFGGWTPSGFCIFAILALVVCGALELASVALNTKRALRQIIHRWVPTWHEVRFDSFGMTIRTESVAGSRRDHRMWFEVVSVHENDAFVVIACGRFDPDLDPREGDFKGVVIPKFAITSIESPSGLASVVDFGPAIGRLWLTVKERE